MLPVINGSLGQPGASLTASTKHAKQHTQLVAGNDTLQGPAQQWVNGFEAQHAEHAERDWADEFATRFTDGTDPNQWMEEFSSDMEAQQAAREAGQPSPAVRPGLPAQCCLLCRTSV